MASQPGALGTGAMCQHRLISTRYLFVVAVSTVRERNDRKGAPPHLIVPQCWGRYMSYEGVPSFELLTLSLSRFNPRLRLTVNSCQDAQYSVIAP